MFQDMVIPTGSTREGGGEFKFEVLSNNGNAYNSRTKYNIDVKSVLPDYYDKLTIDNFSVDSLTPAYSSSQVTADSDLFLDYDSSTGILSTGILIEFQ